MPRRSRRRGAGIFEETRNEARRKELEAIQSRRTTQRAKSIFEERARALRGTPEPLRFDSHSIVAPLYSEEDDSRASSPTSVRTASPPPPSGRARSRRRKAGRRRKTRRQP